jgi:choline dehydrogenase-like flavoprotein
MPARGERWRADVAVVGSGAGGAPLAARLAAAGLEVLVLEAGPRLSSADFDGDEGEMTRRLMRVALASDSGMNVYAGACVGGSTVVNDALCWRPPPEILADWRNRFGLSGLTEGALAPFVEQVWQDVHASPTGRSHLNRNAHRLEVGAARLGWAGEAMPRNVVGCARLGLCNFGCPTNAKQSALVTYLPRAERAGARIADRVRAVRVRVEAGRVAGLECERLDPATGRSVEAIEVDAPRVVLAAGVLETPALLQRSGLGGPRAGRDLQFHSSVHVAARFREEIHGYYGPTMAYAITEWSDVLGRRGPGYMIENVAVHPITVASSLPGLGDAHAERMAALPFLARALVVLRDETRGVLRATGREATLEYTPVPRDLARLRDGMRAIARAFLASGATEVYLPWERTEPVRSEADLAALPDLGSADELTLLYAVHLFGGAGMGATADTSVCDERGAVWGVRGLHVCDAASLPGNTGVNPQITVMAHALRVAEGIAAAPEAA